MSFLKHFAGKQIYDLDDQDILDFLIFKDTNDSGRTIIHHSACPNIGLASLEDCTDKNRCSFRHTAHSMRIGIVQKLRKGFEEVGRRGPFDPSTSRGDPTRSTLVQEYIVFKHQEQGESGFKSKNAKCIYKYQMDILIEQMARLISSKTNPTIKLRLALRRAMYAFCFTAIRRLAGAGNIHAANTIRMPNNQGLVFNCTWDKTLRMDSQCFGFKCVKNKEPWCAHCVIDEWVLLGKSFGMKFDRGLLFPRINYDGSIKHAKKWKSKDLWDSLQRDLKRFHIYKGETPHSFRHGGTVNSLKQGNSLESTMCLAYMKNISTAKIYSKGIQHLFPTGFSWKEVGVDTNKIDEETLACQMQGWKAFVNEGPKL